MTCLWQPKRRVSHRLTLARRVKTLKGCYTLSTTTDQQQVWLNPFLRMIIKQVRSKPAKRIPVCYVCGGRKVTLSLCPKKSSKTDQKMLCTTIKCGCKTTNLWYDEEEEDDDRYHRSLPLTWFFFCLRENLYLIHIYFKNVHAWVTGHWWMGWKTQTGQLLNDLWNHWLLEKRIRPWQLLSDD